MTVTFGVTRGKTEVVVIGETVSPKHDNVVTSVKSV